MNDSDVTIFEQIEKFSIKSLYGFQTVIIYGLGARLGIFDYLLAKGKEAGESVESVTFTFDELANETSLDREYLEAWLHMGLECGIFEIESTEDRILKTAPHVYNLLIDRENMFYVGGNLSTFYLMAPYQNTLAENFRTGVRLSYLDLPPEDYQLGQSACTITSRAVENVYSRIYDDHRRGLDKGGSILEVGCGYGYNLGIWGETYEKALIVGIDIDPNGVAFSKEIIKRNNWQDRIEVLQTSINNYASSHIQEFDLILMNHVLHEMDPDYSYRKDAFKDLYSMLKDDGILIVVEHNIPDMFEPKMRNLFFEVWHKLFEVGMESKFYSRDEFQEFVAGTPFETAELVEDENVYFWVLKRK
ncbi:MAG: class I SAM-dependent methyltransferase [Candidatus Thorarchaeota archaeon]